jgi:tRNA(His) 5'-end guanylyltransferase
MKDQFGDRLKLIEQVEAGRRADPYKPLMMRIDGNCFSRFTKDLERPFDERFVNLMIETTKFLVDKWEFNLGYCQSDEITLYWNINKHEYSNREFLFSGKYQKLASVIPSSASSFFASNIPNYLPEKVGNYPCFDCRVWNVDDMEEVYDNFLWRQLDATKNSVSMYARYFFSHKQLQNKSSKEMKEMLRQAGNPWESLPRFFTHGTFIRRQKVEVLASPDIPEKYRPTDPIIRSLVQQWNPGKFTYDKFIESYS